MEMVPSQQISGKMWFGGGTGLTAGQDQAIGYAILQPQPLPPICTGLCLQQNTLYLVNKYTHGAPIQSVAWSCPTTDCPTPLAAIGGYKGCTPTCDCASIRAYTLDTSTSTLTPIYNIDIPLPTDYVYSVNWCCLPSALYPGTYLVVAGCPNNGAALWVYRYDPNTNSLVQVFKFTHDGIIYATQCVTLTCEGLERNYEVIVGQEAGGANIEVFKNNPATQELLTVDQALFGDTLYALDVCYDNNGCATIVVGGTPFYECGQLYNIRIYKMDCNGLLMPITSAYYEGGTVRTLKWCCNQNSSCSKLWYLAVGGDPIKEGPNAGKNIQLYYYVPGRDIFKTFCSSFTTR